MLRVRPRSVEDLLQFLLVEKGYDLEDEKYLMWRERTYGERSPYHPKG